MVLRGWVFAFVLSGCVWAPQSVTTGGALCIGEMSVFVTEPSQPVAVDANTPTTWTWSPRLCLSSSCSAKTLASASAGVTGNVVTVTTNATWDEARGLVLQCTDDCRRPAAQFEMPALAPGTYTLKHGGREATLTVPSMSPQCPLVD